MTEDDGTSWPAVRVDGIANRDCDPVVRDEQVGGAAP
jgi:hypothetical protein